MKINNIIKGNEIVKVYPTTTIRDALSTMNNSGVRRITVVDAGSNRVEGVITSMDIVDFIGGGSKYNLVKSKHDRNLFAAINEPVKEIMTTEPICVKESANLKEVINLFIEKNVGGMPVVDRDHKLISLITERDILKHLKEDIDKNEKIDKYTTKNPIVATAGERLKDVARTMLRNGFRRLPVISEDKLVGMITSTDFIRLLGSDWAFEHLKTGNVREITNVRIKDIMVKEVITIDKDTPLYDAVEMMINNNIGALPVVHDEKLIGIFTEKDAVSYFKE